MYTLSLGPNSFFFLIKEVISGKKTKSALSCLLELWHNYCPTTLSFRVLQTSTTYGNTSSRI